MRAQLCIALVVCVLAAAPVSVRAQQDESSAIRALEMKWAEAYRLHHLDVLSSLIAEDYVITFEDGSVRSKIGVMSYLSDPSHQVAVSEFLDLKIRMHGDTAVATGAYHERGESDGKSYDYNDRMTDVWMKNQGSWKLIASHYSLPTH